MREEQENILFHFFDVLANMIWQIYWPLAFGLMLSSFVRHLLPVSTVAKHLGQTNIKSLTFATLLGVMSSSCSYAAASLSHTLLTKKATLANAIAFLVSSTNLILEMFIVLVALLGWTFLWGEVLGGLILIMTVAIMFHRFYPKDVERSLRDKLDAEQSQNNVKDSDCGMDMSSKKHNDEKVPAEIFPSATMKKITSSASFFHMDLAMIGKEIAIGVLVSSLLISLVPLEGWRILFISDSDGLPTWLHSLLDVVIGIFVAMIAYVCSVGNLLLAAALWHGGISFGGVIGFILADVLTIPMIRVYQKYYGTRPTKWIVGLLFLSILFTGLCVDAVFNGLDIATQSQNLRPLIQDGFGWNTTTIMNLIFIPLSIWFYRLGKKANAGMGMAM
ncbi:permease [Enterovibrio norvegicus]|uniref:Permease n=1 Tax=Enterovibrio norvegicus TaxID=188144 RepID=A0ABV4L295_9GAMM|nr:permease [Enterovibrio norvegicus]OEF55497.1 metal ion permease [Enterovibrio norvegicus]